MIPVNMPSAKDIRDLYAEVCTDETELDDIEAKWRWLLNHPECALVRSLLENGFTLTFDYDAFEDDGIVMFDVAWGITDGATGLATHSEYVRVRFGWDAADRFVCPRAECKQNARMYWEWTDGAWGDPDIEAVARAAIELKEMVANHER
jgi:hypothetical protein